MAIGPDHDYRWITRGSYSAAKGAATTKGGGVAHKRSANYSQEKEQIPKAYVGRKGAEVRDFMSWAKREATQFTFAAWASNAKKGEKR